jgi:hypothetical protein
MVTRPISDVETVMAMRAQGLATAEIARRTSIPRSTIRYWLGQPAYLDRLSEPHGPPDPCPSIRAVPPGPYAYLLGMYLGDGCLTGMPPGVYRLRIFLDTRYPGIVEECASAMIAVLPNKVGRFTRAGCVELFSYSKHWACLFPQHGAGPKHLRSIALDSWQCDIAFDQQPELFLRGLIQSDGWRGTNKISAGYSYPQYQFSNRSKDIRDLFTTACERMDIACRPMGPWVVAVSRRAAVAQMDTFVGPKR